MGFCSRAKFIISEKSRTDFFVLDSRERSIYLCISRHDAALKIVSIRMAFNRIILFLRRISEKFVYDVLISLRTFLTSFPRSKSDYRKSTTGENLFFEIAARRRERKIERARPRETRTTVFRCVEEKISLARARPNNDSFNVVML